MTAPVILILMMIVTNQNTMTMKAIMMTESKISMVVKNETKERRTMRTESSRMATIYRKEVIIPLIIKASVECEK